MFPHLRIHFLLSLSIVCAGCDGLREFQQHDPRLQLNKKDYDVLTQEASPVPLKKKHALKKSKGPAEEPLSAKFYIPISVTVTHTVPLKDLFLTLAQQANVDVIVHQNIRGGYPACQKQAAPSCD
jgi:hypothetical protein